MSNLQHRIHAAAQLGLKLMKGGEAQEKAVESAYIHNRWFTPESIMLSIESIAQRYLDEERLNQWVSEYNIIDKKPQKVGLILAGNIPLVGFHDLLSVYISGHKALIKSSSKDDVLMRYVMDELIAIDPAAQIEFIDRLKDYDSVIATGSNNSSRYFEEYFSHVPHIIRRNRNSIAVLNGEESVDDLVNLGKDIFTYFGLGCRNVSKIYIPEGYSFDLLLETLHDNFKEAVLHHKYKNNFDFNHALFMLNKEEFLMSGSLLIKKSDSIASRIASVNYEYYSNSDDLNKKLETLKESIQCIVSNEPLTANHYPLGQAQSPGLSDYADGVDTMAFLTSEI